MDTSSLGALARIAGPLAKPTKTPLEWMSWAVAAFAAVYIAWCIPTPAGYFFAVGLPLLVLRFPITGIVAVAVVAQEVSSTGHRGFLNTLGHDVYISGGKIPIILPLALVAALAVMSRSPGSTARRVRPGDVALFGSVIGLIVLTIGVGLVGGQSVFSAVNQNGRPFILLLLGLVIGASLRQLRSEAKLLTVTVGVALTALIAAAAIAVPLGDSANEHVSRYFIYYDWALPAIAVAVLIALLGDPAWRWDWRHMIIAAGTPLLVLVSFRRAVWIAAVLVLVVALVLTWPRWKQALGRLAFAGLTATVVVLAAPGFAADLVLRSGVSAKADDSTGSAGNPVGTPSTPSAGAGPPAASPPAGTSAKPPASPPAQAEKAQRQAESTTGHVEDLRLGWKYVQENFWTGVGPKSPQLPGLAAKGTARVYVHNELLQVWLRYGIVAPLLLALFFLSAGLMALRTLRDSQSDVIARSAAAFSLVAPVVLMTGAFLTDTSRWPLLVGIAAGLLARPWLEHSPAASRSSVTNIQASGS